MPFLMHNWSLVLIAVVSGGLLMWPAIAKGARGGLSPNGAVQLINREKAVVVDVCESEEFAAGHVAGARNIPLNQLEQRLPEVVKNKTVPLVLVCQTGGRAQRALGIAKTLGYDKAVVLGGGMSAWKEANLPLEKA
ncbi:rhodanese-like domain-containing protein [Ramlibacter sp. XY19]|uniref:rhodanese-like domain-containing protein n=1 Tax=Ramlibacter paludis TaxID=2908000 RepID=UPI0023DAA23E|nr:rhodanese-like domain-containing protein [Ramlibacter paludis]MCG2592095.1 rhodanese-like domain-containing protein [Ramlibacter paludis]